MREHQFGALLLLDLDDFKTLNDTCGHDVGDQLLIAVARRLGETLRECDSAARLGGDEFVVLLEALGSDQNSAATKAEGIAEKIRAAISKPISLNSNMHYTTPSIGVTLFRGHTDTTDALLRQALKLKRRKNFLPQIIATPIRASSSAAPFPKMNY